MTLGAFVSGLVINRWGRQPVILVASVLSIAGAFLQFFCTNLTQFIGGKILTGLVRPSQALPALTVTNICLFNSRWELSHQQLLRTLSSWRPWQFVAPLPRVQTSPSS